MFTLEGLRHRGDVFMHCVLLEGIEEGHERLRAALAIMALGKS